MKSTTRLITYSLVTFCLPTGLPQVRGLPRIFFASEHYPQSTRAHYDPYQSRGTSTIYPYVQNVQGTSAAILWYSTGADQYLCYGESAMLGMCVSPNNQDGYYEATLTNLAEDTLYYYQACDDMNCSTGLSDVYTFSTAPSESATTFSFLVFGDSGNSAYHHQEQQMGPSQYQQLVVAQQINAHIVQNPVDLMLHVGDVSQSTGSLDNYKEEFFDVYGGATINFLSSIPVYPTLGNHDVYESAGPMACGVDAYLKVFSLPTAPLPCYACDSGQRTEMYYSFDYANVHFVCLNSNLVTESDNCDSWNGRAELCDSEDSCSLPCDVACQLEEMTSWLYADLQENTRHWTVVFFHHPIYQVGFPSQCEPLPQNHEQYQMRSLSWGAYFDQFGVDLVLNGHRHNYSRTWPLISGQSGGLTPPGVVDPPVPGVGVVYVVSGGGGYELHSLHPK